MIRVFDEAEARHALPCKWGVPDGVLPAWVAEMDVAIAPEIEQALVDAVRAGVTGYPALSAPDLGEAYAGFAARRFVHTVDPTWVVPTVDVTAGIRLALDAWAPPGPVVVPVPAYPPQLDLPGICGRERVDVPLDPDAERAGLDLAALDAALAGGGRTLLLTQPHNPCGRVYGRAELEAVRDLVVRHDARVISDEIHAPLVLPGREHVSYLALEGTAGHAIAVVAASKAFNTAGLRCAQLVLPDPGARERLLGVPMARNDSWSPLGVVAAVAAYTHGDAWLDALLGMLDDRRRQLADLLAEHLPAARMRPLEATYLAWLDLRAYGHDDPAAVALERGRVKVSPGHDYHPGLPGHVRLNIATSANRLAEVVRRLASAL